MLHTTNRISQQRTVLRCFWVPTHTGVNAPLSAVWVEATELDSGNQSDPANQEDLDVSLDGPDLLPCAA
jgi:hypothetical protein